MRSSTHRHDGGAAGHSPGERAAAGGAAVDAAIAGISEDFQHFITDLEQLVHATTTLTGDELVNAKARLSARVASARENFEQIGSGLASRSRRTIKAADQYLHQEPWTVIAISAAAALVFGFLLGRRGGGEP